MKSTRLNNIVLSSFIFGLSLGLSFLIGGQQTPWNLIITAYSFITFLFLGALALALVLKITSASWSDSLLQIASSAALTVLPLGAALLFFILLNSEKIFYWAKEPENLWFTLPLFTLRNVITLLGLFLGVRALRRFMLAPETVKPSEIRFLHLALFFLLLFVYGGTITAWDFGMTLDKHYTDTIYGLKFLVSSLFGGTSLLVLLGAYLNSRNGFLVTDEQIFNLAKLQLAFSIIWFWLWGEQLYIIWYANIPEETGPFYLRIFSSQAALYTYALSVIFASIIPFLVLIWKRFNENKQVIGAIAVINLIGLWMHRYLEVSPSLLKYNIGVKFGPLHPISLLFVFAFIALTVSLFKPIPADLDSAQSSVITKLRGWG